MKNLIFWGGEDSLKNLTFMGVFTKNQGRWELPRNGAWTVCSFKGGAWQKREGRGCF